MSDDGPGAREVAYRVFAAEFDDASLSYSESDEERAPNYVVTPTGARVNRLFTAGVLTEVERVNDETRRGRVVDPSGAFVTYAGQYQPEAQTFLERAEPPAFVALTGKARTFEPEDSDRVFTSVRPESLNEVDADTRDRWVVSAAEATLDRLAVFAKALDADLRGDDLRAALEAGGAPAPLAAGIPKALDHYGTTAAYAEAVRRLAVDALEMIAGDRDEVRALEIAPDEGDATAIGPLPETDVTIAEPSATAESKEDAGSEPEPSPEETDAEPTAESVSTAESESTTESASTAESEPPTGSDSTTGSDPSTTDTDSSLDDSTESESTPTADSDPLGDDASDSTGTTDEGDAATDEGDAATDEGGLGDFDAGDGEDASAEFDADGDADATADLDPDADADDMYQLDEEEREEIESEFGTDFATGTEVDEPGEADIDVPDPEELAEEAEDPAAAAEEAAAPGAESDEADSMTADDGETDTDTDAEDVDLEAAAVAAMDALDDGDGAPREAVVERVADEHGVEPGAVEDAIQDALMSGQCYEPGDGLLKPI